MNFMSANNNVKRFKYLFNILQFCTIDDDMAKECNNSHCIPTHICNTREANKFVKNLLKRVVNILLLTYIQM